MVGVGAFLISAITPPGVDPLWVVLAGVITAGGVITGPLLLLRAQAKAETRRSQREEAAKAEEQRQREEVARTAEKAAALLLAAQSETTRLAQEAAKGTKEVARLVAEGDAGTSKLPVQEATPVVLLYPDGERQEVVLSGVPREGELIRLRNGRNDPRLLVQHVLWLEAFLPPPNPSVIVVVRPEHAAEAAATATP
jgi:hypothetical protein